MTEPFTGAESGATADAIAALEAAWGATLPPDFAAFLRDHDGGSGFVGAGGYLSIDTVQGMQASLGEPFLPDEWLNVGGDGGGMYYYLDRSTEPPQFLYVDPIMPDEYREPAGSSFEDLLAFVGRQ